MRVWRVWFGEKCIIRRLLMRIIGKSTIKTQGRAGPLQEAQAAYLSPFIQLWQRKIVRKQGQSAIISIQKEPCLIVRKGVPVMTALYAFVTLVAAYVVYAIYDARRDDAMTQVDDFYQAEYKKSYAQQNEYAAMGWR